MANTPPNVRMGDIPNPVLTPPPPRLSLAQRSLPSTRQDLVAFVARLSAKNKESKPAFDLLCRNCWSSVALQRNSVDRPLSSIGCLKAFMWTGCGIFQLTYHQLDQGFDPGRHVATVSMHLDSEPPLKRFKEGDHTYTRPMTLDQEAQYHRDAVLFQRREWAKLGRDWVWPK